MASLWKRILLQVVVLLACFYFVWPPAEKLRFGRDLAGGVSLVYTVEFEENEDPALVMPALVAAIKDRLDPNGVMEISVVALGRNRLEIQMPLARQEVKDLRAQFEESLRTLGNFRPSADTLRRAFELPVEQRETRLRDLAAGQQVLLDKLKEAAGLYAARAALDEQIKALPADADAATRDALVAQRAEINPKYRAVVESLEASVIAPDTLRRVLSLSNARRMIKGEDGKTLVPDFSQQDIKLKEVRERFPLRVSEINTVVENYQKYIAQRKSLDDPQDLIRLLRGSGELTFRIPVPLGAHPEEQALRQELQEKGPAAARRPDARWFKINQIANWYESVGTRDALLANPPAYFAGRRLVGEAYIDGYYLLMWDTENAKLTAQSGTWKVAGAADSRDELGKPAISFTMDDAGALLLGDLTSKHVGKPMGVLLDDEVYTAPTLNSTISRSGQITNVDAEDERRYIIKVLNAGALQAKLSTEPISQSILSPSLGRDNLVRGMNAGYISIAICAGFLILYYFLCGVVSTVALFLNTFLLIALMALNKAAFTLPGIAGVILAFAMAVDANVLIFERMREELAKGLALKEAVRLGYSRAMAAIIDGNLTHLLVCSVLFLFGTTEIRGFAVTMSIGVATTLFAQLVFTRLIFDLALKLGWRKTTMLPMAVPAVQRAFTLSVDWMRLRTPFYAVAIIATALSAAFMSVRGKDMFDTEFRGGTQVVLQLKTDDTGKPVTLKRAEVEERFLNVAEKDGYPRDLRAISVQVIDPAPDQSSHKFRINTLVPDASIVTKAMLEAFGDVIERRAELTFKGSDLAGGESIPAFQITRPRLGDVVGKPDLSLAIPEYRGGIATVLEGLNPPVSLRELEDRLNTARNRPDIRNATRTITQTVVLEGDEKAVRSAFILALDAEHASIGDESWITQVRDTEWAAIRAALTQETQLLSANTFSPAIAATFVAQAVLCVVVAALLIVLFIWIRFNSIRFSIAAIVPTLMDCTIAVGLIAAAEIIYDSFPGVAHSLGMVPFKIDLNVVASILTVLGYSINDKIVLLDRVRENRGRARVVTRQIVNDSVNQCLSRTLLTGTTTILSTVVLYVVGGDALKPFAYSLGIGIVVGTLSSIMIAAPLVCGARTSGTTDQDLDPLTGLERGANTAPSP
jgi:SecD/SecF fusion protein